MMSKWVSEQGKEELKNRMENRKRANRKKQGMDPQPGYSGTFSYLLRLAGIIW